MSNSSKKTVGSKNETLDVIVHTERDSLSSAASAVVLLLSSDGITYYCDLK
jgi:hypothetical protein